MRMMSGGAFAASVLGGGSFSPLSLSPAGFWLPDPALLFEEEDGTGTITATEAVGYMTDQSGTGKHVTQAVAGARSTYQTSGGLDFLLSDGTDDVLNVDFAALAHPFEIVAALRIITAAGTENMIGGGITNNNGAIFTTAGANINLFAGSTLTGPTIPGDGVDFVVTARFNGASSRIAVDNGSYTTGDAGSTASTGISFGFGPGGAGASNMRFYGAVLVPRLLTDTEVAKLRTYFGKKQGRTL